MNDIRTISLALPYKLGAVNCYLVETGSGFVLVDTGSSIRRAELEGELTSAGCQPGNLRLIVTVYPGHGKPFPMESFLKDRRGNQ